MRGEVKCYLEIEILIVLWHIHLTHAIHEV